MLYFGKRVQKGPDYKKLIPGAQELLSHSILWETVVNGPDGRNQY